jgi:formate hydrogenlyase transcriptional activator
MVCEGGAGHAVKMPSESASALDPQYEVNRYEALLDLADLMVRHFSLSELFHELAQRLQRVAEFELLHFSLYDPKENVMRRHLWEGEASTIPEVVPLAESASGFVWENQTPLLIRDLLSDQRFPQILGPLREKGFRTYYVLPLTTAQSRLGGLGVGSRRVDAYGEQDLRLLIRVAELVAMAVEAALTKEALLEERRRLQALVDVNRELVSSLEIHRLLPLISECVTRVVPHDFAGVTLYEDDSKALKAFVLSPSDKRPVVEMGRSVTLDQTISAQAFLEQRPQLLTRNELSLLNAPIASRMLDAGIQTVLCMPMVTSKGTVGTLNVGSKRDHAFSTQDAELLNQIAAQLAIALENARAYREIQSLKERLSQEKLYLEGEIQTELHFEEIIGESTELKKVLNQARTVAPSGSTALILGETGTGKELIARAIHRMSKRKDASFIKVNCAAIPTGLLESELFGHEKGAFTGAVNQKVGRIELADQGTLFLDEIGDIPLELQPKLLRVLQDQEFERLGGIKTIRVDVRLLAATNRDLSKDVGAGEFRSDLFYRLNVFPIRMPPLRDRRSDIPLLVRHFVHKLAKRMDKKIDTIPNATVEALTNWQWPGNVRELENFIERSVILTEGNVLRVPLSELRPQVGAGGVEDTTLQAAERDYIIRVLRESGGLVSGARGAAAKLGLKRTTLQSKMRKLNIQRKDFVA